MLSSLEKAIKNAERDQTPEAQFAVAKMLVAQKRYDEALPWLSSSSSSVPEAQYIFGVFNEKGLGGLAKDDEKAFQMYSLAAQQGFTEAQFLVGMFLYKYQQKYADAFPWFELAASNGHANAQFMLGYFYEKGIQGILVKKDAKAFEFYQKAALQGLVRAQLKMGQLYKMGELVQRDDDVAKEWFLLAARQGDSQGQYEYARAIFNEDMTKGVALFEKAAAQDNADAQFALGKCFEAGEGGLAKNIDEAMRYYEMAAKAGQKVAQYELGLSLLEGQNVAMNVRAGTDWIVLSAKQNYAEAQEYLGEMYYQGTSVVPKDEVEGIKWYNLAAVNESYKAQYNMGLICWEKKQYLKGLKWFKLSAATAAADQDNTKTFLTLAKIYAEGLDGVGKDKEKALLYYRLAGVRDDDDKLTALTEGIVRNHETLRQSLTTVKTKAFISNWMTQIFKNPKDTIVEFVSQEEPFNTENPFNLVEMKGMHWVAVKKISQELRSNTLNSLLRAIKMSLEMFKQEKNISFLLYASGLVGMYQNEVLQHCDLMDLISVRWKGVESGVPVIVTPTQAVAMVQSFQWIFFDMVCRLIKCVGVSGVTVPYDENSFTLFDMFYANDGFIVGNCVLQSMFEACVLQNQGVPIEKIYFCLQIDPDSTPRRTMQSLQRDNNVPSQGGVEGWRGTHWLTNYNSGNGNGINAGAPPPAKKPRRLINKREISGFPKCGREKINYKDHADYIAQSVLYMNMWFFKKKMETHKKISLFDSYRATKLNAILFLYLRTLLEGETTLVSQIVADYLQNEQRDDDETFFELDKSAPECLEAVTEAQEILAALPGDKVMQDILQELMNVEEKN